MLKYIKFVYLVSVIFALTLSGKIVLDLVKIQSLQKQQAFDAKLNLVWFLSQADREARKLSESVIYYHLRDSTQSRHQMLTDFDILWSRYDLGLNDHIELKIEAIPTGKEILREIRRSIVQLEPLVTVFKSVNQAEFNKIMHHTQVQIDHSYALVIKAMQQDQIISFNRQQSIADLYLDLLVTLLGMFAGSALLIFIFLLRAKELKDQNVVFEKHVRERTVELNKSNESLLLEARVRKLADKKAQQLISAFNQSTDIVFFLDKNNKFIFYNQSFKTINKHICQSVYIGATFEDYLTAVTEHPNNRLSQQEKPKWKAHWLKGLQTSNNAFEISTAGKKHFIFNIDRLEDGNVIIIGADVTPAKKSQAALIKSETRFKDFALLAADWYWEMDENLIFTFTSGSITNTTGLAEDFFIGRGPDSDYGIEGVENKKIIKEILAKVDTKKSFHEYQTKWRTMDNKLVTISFSGEPKYSENGAFVGYIGAARDITERCVVEERDKRFLEAINSLNLMVSIYDDADNLIFYNRQFKVFSDEMGKSLVLGVSFKELWYSACQHFSKTYDFDMNTWFEKRIKLHQKPPSNLVLEIHKNRYLNIYEQRLDDGGIIVISTDITQSKKAEQEINMLRHYLTSVIDSMSSILITVDEKCRVTQWNKAAHNATGIEFQAANDQKLLDVFPRLVSQHSAILDAIESGRQSSFLKQPYVANEMPCYADITIYPLASQNMNGAVIRLDNVTEQFKLSEMMIQSEKMLSLGELAAGMAHEINNPLAGMMQTASVMLNRLSDEALPANCKAAKELAVDMHTITQYMQQRGVLGMLDNIIESGGRVATIVDNMLDFSRHNDSARSEYRLDKLLDKALKLSMSDHSLKQKYDFKNIAITRQYQFDLPSVSCESGKIQQVFLNLLRNAAQAMQDAATPAPRIDLRAYCTEGSLQVTVEVEDNGPGISDEVMRRIFEPFFTTKSEGLGTGLGLSVSYFIITDNHGGKLSVESVLGEYSKFTIRLPKAYLS